MNIWSLTQPKRTSFCQEVWQSDVFNVMDILLYWSALYHETFVTFCKREHLNSAVWYNDDLDSKHIIALHVDQCHQKLRILHNFCLIQFKQIRTHCLQNNKVLSARDKFHLLSFQNKKVDIQWILKHFHYVLYYWLYSTVTTLW